MKATTDPSEEIDGLSLKAEKTSRPLPSKTSCVLVNCEYTADKRLKKNISGLPSVLPLPTRFLVETKAIMFPSSLIVALRLSSATNGSTVLLPGVGAILAGVLVICVNTPVSKAKGGKSAPVVKSTSGTAGTS